MHHTSVLIWRGNYTELLPEMLKHIPIQRLGKYVCYMFLCQNIIKYDIPACSLLSQIVIFYRNMFFLGVLDRVFGQTYGTCVVTMDDSGLFKHNLNIL